MLNGATIVSRDDSCGKLSSSQRKAGQRDTEATVETDVGHSTLRCTDDDYLRSGAQISHTRARKSKGLGRKRQTCVHVLTIQLV